MGTPSVLILDESPNGFDVETLASTEDMLASFGGTITCVSQDRHFLERVCDAFVRLPGDGKIGDFPGGIDDYPRLRGDGSRAGTAAAASNAAAGTTRDRRRRRPADRPAREALMSTAREY